MYEIVRTIYTTQSDSTEEARVSVLQQTLSQLRLTNIATLDACMNHFTRLIELTSADEQYVQELATSLAPCVLRPRADTSLTMEEKHAYRLVRDLFAHKNAIFSELKRMSSLSHSSSIGSGSASRPRAISTDESNRRAHMEERQRALLEKVGTGSVRGRDRSPAPSPRHRRDRSTGGPETRFPVAVTTSPTSGNERHRASLGATLQRNSLEVPGDGSTPSPPDTSNGELRQDEGGLVKRDSLGLGGRFASRKTTPSTPPSAEDRGVTLSDKPMDD